MKDRSHIKNDDLSGALGKQDFFALLIIFSLVFLVYSIVVVSTFGVLDDYSFLHNGIVGNDGTSTLLFGAGRPLNALLLDFGFWAAGTIENLAHLRLVTLVGISLLGCGIYLFARRHDVAVISSLLMACGVILLPSFQVYSAWAQHFTTPFAGGIALLSAYVLTPACSINRRSWFLSIFLATILLSIAVLTYQPIAMLFCTGILISTLSSKQPLAEWSPVRVVAAAITFFCAMLIGLVALKVGQFYYPSGSARYGLVSDLFGKASWFVNEPLLNALSFYAVPGNKVAGALCGATMIVGALLYLRRNKAGSGVYALMLSSACVIGSYAPNLATAENWASYRSMGALSASLLVMFAILIADTMEKKIQKLPENAVWTSIRRVAVAVTVSCFLIISVRVQKDVSGALVFPNVTEINNLASFLREKKELENVTEIYVHPSSWMDSSATPIAYDEFGMQSALNGSYASVIVDIVRLSLNVFSDAKISVVIDDVHQFGLAGDSTKLYVDFRRLVTSGRFKTIDSRLLQVNSGSLQVANISDSNWTNGIWTNLERPNDYSFVLLNDYRAPSIKVGDKVVFHSSGERVVLRVDVSENFVNVLVDGPPLSSSDGYPKAISRSQGE